MFYSTIASACGYLSLLRLRGRCERSFRKSSPKPLRFLPANRCNPLVYYSVVHYIWSAKPVHAFYGVRGAWVYAKQLRSLSLPGRAISMCACLCLFLCCRLRGSSMSDRSGAITWPFYAYLSGWSDWTEVLSLYCAIFLRLGAVLRVLVVHDLSSLCK